MIFKLTSASGIGGFDMSIRDKKGIYNHLENMGYSTIKSAPIYFDTKDSSFKVEINTLEDLMNFIKEIENVIVVSEEEIIIYDGYLE